MHDNNRLEKKKYKKKNKRKIAETSVFNKVRK